MKLKKCQYRTLNCYRSAVSSTLSIDPASGQPVGRDPLVSRSFRGVSRLQPPRIKLFPNWSIATVLSYLKSIGDSRSLSLSQLLVKPCFLMSLVCCTRPACLHNMRRRFLDTRNFPWLDWGAKLWVLARQSFGGPTTLPCLSHGQP